jgi:hypothetical protein
LPGGSGGGSWCVRLRFFAFGSGFVFATREP